MLKVKYEQYWNDSNRKIEELTCLDLEDLENWMFDQMEQNYTVSENAMNFPTPEVALRIGARTPWAIGLKPKQDGETFLVRLIQSDQGIIFSDGTFTAGQKHWSTQVRDWLIHCEERRKAPQFNFVE